MTIESREKRQPWTLLSPALATFTLLLIVPLLFIVVYSFWLRSAAGADTPGFHLDNWQKVLSDRFYRDILLNTLKIAAITTVICAVMGYPAAYLIARSRGNKLILLVLLILPSWISYITRTMSWINILGVSEALNSALLASGVVSEPIQMLYNEVTVILGLVHFLLPFMVLNIYVSLEGIDTNHEAAANSLGVTRWQSFVHVTLPLSQHRPRLPELRAFPSPDGGRQRRLRPALPQCGDGRDRTPRGRGAGICSASRPRRALSEGAFRRPAAARHAGPRDRAPRIAATSPAKLVIRAEKLDVLPAEAAPNERYAVAGTVETVDYQGQSARYFLRVGRHALQAINMIDTHPLPIGAEVSVRFGARDRAALPSEPRT